MPWCLIIIRLSVVVMVWLCSVIAVGTGTVPTCSLLICGFGSANSKSTSEMSQIISRSSVSSLWPSVSHSNLPGASLLPALVPVDSEGTVVLHSCDLSRLLRTGLHSDQQLGQYHHTQHFFKLSGPMWVPGTFCPGMGFRCMSPT